MALSIADQDLSIHRKFTAVYGHNHDLGKAVEAPYDPAKGQLLIAAYGECLRLTVESQKEQKNEIDRLNNTIEIFQEVMELLKTAIKPWAPINVEAINRFIGDVKVNVGTEPKELILSLLSIAFKKSMDKIIKNNYSTEEKDGVDQKEIRLLLTEAIDTIVGSLEGLKHKDEDKEFKFDLKIREVYGISKYFNKLLIKDDDLSSKQVILQLNAVKSFVRQNGDVSEIIGFMSNFNMQRKNLKNKLLTLFQSEEHFKKTRENIFNSLDKCFEEILKIELVSDSGLSLKRSLLESLNDLIDKLCEVDLNWYVEKDNIKGGLQAREEIFTAVSKESKIFSKQNGGKLEKVLITRI